MTSNLVIHAERELTLAGYAPPDPEAEYKEWDPDLALREGVLKIVQEFADQGHSGFSASISANILNKLLRFEPLTPITDDPAEWQGVSLQPSTDSFDSWQNIRDSRAFSWDGGKHYYLVDDKLTWLASYLIHHKGWRFKLYRLVWNRFPQFIHKHNYKSTLKEQNA